MSKKERKMETKEAILVKLQAELKAIKEREDKCQELIMAVGNKYKGETRHETALRYIKQAEEGDNIGKAYVLGGGSMKEIIEVLEEARVDVCTNYGEVFDRDKFQLAITKAIEVLRRVDCASGIARAMTKRSEDKYYGKAFVFNYMVDDIAEAIQAYFLGEGA